MKRSRKKATRMEKTLGAGQKAHEVVTWDRKSPCNDCPFLKSSPPHSGILKDVPHTIQSIKEFRFAHTCHKTDNREDCDGPHKWTGEKPQHCAGAILMFLKTGGDAQFQVPFLLAAQHGLVDLDEWEALAKADSDCFTLREFLDFYLRYLKRELLKREIERVKEGLPAVPKDDELPSEFSESGRAWAQLLSGAVNV